MGAGWMNLGSLVLGLLALILPVVALFHKTGRTWPLLCTMSLAACAAALFLQLRYTGHLVYKQDWSALLDTSDAVVGMAGLLLAATAALNVVVLVVRMKKR